MHFRLLLATAYFEKDNSLVCQKVYIVFLSLDGAN